MKSTSKLATIALVTVLVGLTAAAGFAKEEATPVVHTVQTMAAEVGQLEGQEITVTGTVVGICASGCSGEQGSRSCTRWTPSPTAAARRSRREAGQTARTLA